MVWVEYVAKLWPSKSNKALGVVEMFGQNDEFSFHQQGAGLFVGSTASQTKPARSPADSLQLTAPTRSLDTIGLSLAVCCDFYVMHEWHKSSGTI